MKRIVIAILVVLGVVFLYLTLAVNTKRNELQEFKKQIESDSASYHSTHSLDSNNKKSY